MSMPTDRFVFYLFTLVRTQLEYAVPVWNPFYNKYTVGIERVQRKYLRSMTYRCFHRYDSYPNLLSRYKLCTIESRRKYLEAVTLYNILHNKFDCIDLVARLCYVVPRTCTPRATRARTLFALTPYRTNSGLRVPIRRMIESYNLLFIEIDIFYHGIYKFKNLVNAILFNTDSLGFV